MQEFSGLLEEQIPRLRRYARALTREATRSDDLVQDCLCCAVQKQHLFEPGTNLRAWLLTIMHNQHINHVRRDLREGFPERAATSVGARLHRGIQLRANSDHPRDSPRHGPLTRFAWSRGAPRPASG
jgi:DNA-directed RNA polymerase specialized sigma24 family protein